MINALIVLGCVVAGVIVLLCALFTVAFIIISRGEADE